MPQTKKVLDAIDKKINDVMTSYKAGAMDQLAKKFGRGVEADILNTYEMVGNFNKIWPQIRGRLGEKPKDEPLNVTSGQNPEEAQRRSNQIRTLINKSVSKPFFDFKKQILDPTAFTEEMMTLSPDEIDEITRRIEPAETENVDATGRNTDIGGKETKETEKPTAADKTKMPKTTAKTGAAQVTEPGGARPEKVKQSDNELEKIATDLAKKKIFTGKEAIANAQSFLAGLRSAGYQITG